jgi:hypothetical protein
MTAWIAERLPNGSGVAAKSGDAIWETGHEVSG